DSKGFGFADFIAYAARRAKESFPKGRLDSWLLLDVAEQKAVQNTSLAEIKPHPLFRTALRIAKGSDRHSQRAFRGGGLQLVRQSIVIAAVAVVQEATD